MKRYISNILIALGVILMVCMPKICHSFYGGTTLQTMLMTICVSVPLSFLIITIPTKTAKFILLSLIWLLAMPELLMLATFHSSFTAGEMMALVCANNGEYELLFKLIWLQPKVWWITTTLLFILLVCTVYFVPFNHKRNGIVAGISTVLAGVSIIVFPVQLKELFPYNLIREQGCLTQELYTLHTKQNNCKGTQYNARKEGVVDNEIYVLAIGESLRYKNLGLNNTYPRQTTPLLAQQPNLTLYSNCFSPAVLTQHALPLLLSTATAENFERHYDEGRIGTAFAEAGYVTYLVSNDKQIINDGVHTYLTYGFDSVIYVSADSLIAPCINKLAESERKIFILAHYQGNHFFYSNRTSKYGRWQPDLNDNPSAQSDSLFVNAYDNSVLYTDYILSQNISTLDSLNSIAAFFFISDHGDYFDEHIAVHGHTYHPTKDEYHVPLIVWYSDEYAAAYPEKMANMVHHKDEPVCADHVFWSVLDMADVRVDRAFQQEGMSIFGDTLLPHQRTILLPDGKSIMRLD